MAAIKVTGGGISTGGGSEGTPKVKKTSGTPIDTSGGVPVPVTTNVAEAGGAGASSAGGTGTPSVSTALGGGGKGVSTTGGSVTSEWSDYDNGGNSGSGGGTVSPAGGTGSGSAQQPVTPDSYEEFLLKQEGFYKDQLDKITAYINQNKADTTSLINQQMQQAVQAAETERERGVVDARSSYAQNLATYGANAEKLGDMGLTASGYSDYLSQQAYATQRAETQNANARSEAAKQDARNTANTATLQAEQQANSSLLDAELSYAQNMQSNAEKLAQYQLQKQEKAEAEEEQKKQLFASLLNDANAGVYTAEQLAELGKQYGLDDASITLLQGAADAYASDQAETDAAQQAQYYDMILEGIHAGHYDSEAVATMGAAFKLDETSIAQLQAEADEYAAEQDALKAEQDKEKAEADKDQVADVYNMILGNILSGAYDADDVAYIGAYYNLDETTIANLQEKANEYAADQDAAEAEQDKLQAADIYKQESYNIKLEGADYDTKYLDMLLSTEKLDQSTYDSLMKQYADIVASEGDQDEVDNLYDSGAIDEPTYQGYVDDWNNEIDASVFDGLDYIAAQQAYDEFASNPWASDQKKSELNSAMIRRFATDIAKEKLADGLSASKVTGDVVDIKSSGFSSSQFGSFMNGEDQRDLVTAYMADARAGKIPEGMVCKFNYGASLFDGGYYVYAGDGVFVKYDAKPKQGAVYCPDGFRLWSGGDIVKVR